MRGKNFYIIEKHSRLKLGELQKVRIARDHKPDIFIGFWCWQHSPNIGIEIYQIVGGMAQQTTLADPEATEKQYFPR